MNIHNQPRTIYFARVSIARRNDRRPFMLIPPRTGRRLLQSGQSLIEHSYKADSDLSPAGWEYAERLKAAVMSRRKQVMEEHREAGEELPETKLRVWTSARRRAHHTAWPFVQSGYKVVQKPQMAEINPCVPPRMTTDGDVADISAARHPLGECGMVFRRRKPRRCTPTNGSGSFRTPTLIERLVPRVTTT